jgi:choline dehydrogenase-like flavoprotein
MLLQKSCALLALTLALSSAATARAETGGQVSQEAVRTDDLDLASDSGARRLRTHREGGQAVLMQSGIGDERELTPAGIEMAQHLPGVGSNFQDHILVPGVWEYPTALPVRNGGGEATLFLKSDPSLAAPDLQVIVAEFP